MKVLVTNPHSLLAGKLDATTVDADLHRSRSVHDLLFARRYDAVVCDSRDPEVVRQLLVACEHHPTIRRFIYTSSGDVYQRTAAEPNLLDEDAALDYDRAVADLTACARIANTRVPIAVLRCAEVLAPTGQLWDYLASRVCLRPLGFDPMINLLSVEDLVRAHALALASNAIGIFNIPGADTLPLSRIIRLAGRHEIPLPGPLLAPLYRLRTRFVHLEFSYDRYMRHFHFGGILDGTRARDRLGYVARHLLHIEACGRSRSPSAWPWAANPSEASKTSAI